MDRSLLGQAAIEAEVDRLQRHAQFRKSPKLAALLAYLVQESLAGRGKRLKAYTIATEALGRPEDFDPIANSIVRVEMRRLRGTLQRIYADAEPHQVVVELPVGRYEPVFRHPRANGSAEETGKPDALLSAALHDSEERYAALVKASAVIEWRAEPNGHITRSLGWSERTGQEEEVYRGMGWLQALHPHDRGHTARSWTALCRAGAAFTLSFRVRQQDGHYQPMLARAVPLEQAGGTCRGWIGTMVDQTLPAGGPAAADRENVQHALHRESETAGRVLKVAQQTVLDVDRKEIRRARAIIELTKSLRGMGVLIGEGDRAAATTGTPPPEGRPR